MNSLSTKATVRIAGPLAAAALVLILICGSGCGRSETGAEDRRESADADASPAATGEGQEAPAINLDANTALARVNGEDIIFSDLQKEVEQLVMNLPQMPSSDMLEKQMPSIMQRVLDGMISEQLLKEALAAEQISVPDSDVVKQLRQIASRMPEGKKLSEVLAERGSSLEEFQARLKEGMATRKLIEMKTEEKIEASSEEVESFYSDNAAKFSIPETASAHHILIGFRPEDSEEVKQSKLEEIKDIREQILSGADFEELAREHSSGPSAVRGGDLGRFPRGQMLPAFDQAVFSQPIGEIGEPIETRFGYHIVRVDERAPGRTIPLEEARADIETYLTDKKRQQALNDYLQELRAAADVEILQDVSRIKAKFSR